MSAIPALSIAQVNGMPDTAGTSANNNIRTEHYGTRRRARPHQPSDPSPGTDPPDDTLIQRCCRPHDQGSDIGVLYPPHANPSYGNARHSQVRSAISASLLDFADGHEHSTTPPGPAQTGVCPQSRPTFTPQTAAVRVTQSSTAVAPVAVIPPHSLDAENAFSEGKEDHPHSSWGRSPETLARVQDQNAPADLSPYYGNSAILGQHEACPERDDSERTRPATTPSVRNFQSIHKHFVPLSTVINAYDTSLTYVSDDVVLFWQPLSVFSQWTISPFSVDLVDYTCAEQYMMPQKLAYSATTPRSRRSLPQTIPENKNTSAVKYATSNRTYGKNTAKI